MKPTRRLQQQTSWEVHRTGRLHLTDPQQKLQSPPIEEAVAVKRPRTERSESEMDTEAIVDFVKDLEMLYNKTNEHFKDKARKDCVWKRFASRCHLSVMKYETWFES